MERRRCKKCGAYLSSYNSSEYCRPCGRGEIEVDEYLITLTEAAPQHIESLGWTAWNSLVDKEKDLIKLSELMAVPLGRCDPSLPVFGRTKEDNKQPPLAADKEGS